MNNLWNKVNKLEKDGQKQGAFVQGADWYELRVAPSCPPDKRVHVRGGQVFFAWNWWGGVELDEYEYRSYLVPSLVIDLADPSSVGTDIIFTNANHYQFFMLMLWYPAVNDGPVASDWSCSLLGTGDELQTAQEAEAWMVSEPFRAASSQWLGFHGYSLCGLVLRNDGTPGAGCPILPIDYINRGRSYMWPTDTRHRQYAYR